MLKTIYSIAIILVCTMGAIAQGIIQGNVTDREGEPLPGAYVFLENNAYQDVTDVEGQYRLVGVPEGSYELIISYIGYGDVRQSITVTNGQTLIQNVELNEGTELNEVVINGRLEGQAKALNTQKNKLNITEVIAAEQIERFPDANLGDALKRLAGINVQYDQGEARFANIRGTAPELNSITVNGERVPSAEAEKRFVQLDLIPSDMVGTVEVNKAVTPDMDGDAIGGSINLVTQKAKKGGQIRGTLGSGYSPLTEKPIIKGKLSYSNRFADNKLGIILNASMLDKSVRSDNIEAEWDYTDEANKDGSSVMTDFQIRQYELQRLRQSYAATLDYKVSDNHSVYVSGMYNWRNDWENRYRLRYKDIEQDDEGNTIAEIRRQTKGGIGDNKYRRLEDQRTFSLSGGGEHFFNTIKVNWTLSALEASEDRPNERYISMRAKDQIVNVNLTDTNKPKISPIDADFADLSSGYGLKEISEEFQYTDEKDFNGRLDIEIPVMTGLNASAIKVGGRFKNKDKSRDNKFKEYEPTDEDAFVADALSHTINKTFDNFSPGDYQIGSFVDQDYLGDINLSEGFENEEVLEELAGNFDASEDIIAFYGMYSQQLGEQLSFIAGARYEKTDVSYQGRIFDGESLSNTDEESGSYSNFLPGVHLKYSPNKWSNIRLAWTNTIARPNYFDLVPYQEIDTEDNIINVGNSSLEATTSTNYDLLGEYYFKNLGIISAGVFYKDLKNVIASRTSNDFTFNGNVYDRFSQPVNTGNASLYGFEVGLQRRLDFLPGALSNLSVYANYTHTQSELKDITLEDREDETLPLVGTPENLVNLSLAYDTKKMDVRISYNFAGEFIEEYNDEKYFDRWYGSVNYLDFNLDYKVNNNWKIYFSASNLLDQPLRYYQGVSDRVMQEEFYGAQFKIGAKFKY